MNGLADFLWHRSDVEAVLVDEKERTISVATLGRVDEGELKRCLHETISAIEEEITQGLVGDVKKLPKGLHVKDVKGKTLLEKETCKTAPIFRKWREFPWPEPKEVPKWEHFHEEDWRLLAILAGGCGVFGLTGFILELVGIGPSWLHVLLYIGAMVSGGWDAGHDVVHKIPKGELDIHFLMLAVAIGASSIGAWREGSLLLFLFSFSGALEHLVKHRTRKAIDSLFKTAPKTALVVDESGEEKEISIEQVIPGMEVVVKPGQLFPVDAEVISGDSAADESNLTGESHPISKGIGDEVSSGTINLWGAIHVKVLRPAKESSLQRIIKLIQEAQHLKAPSQRFTDRFGTPYEALRNLFLNG